MTISVRKSVLIVDDNIFIRRALCESFKHQADFEVCGEAENGEKAIEKARELHPDLIVLDLSMPVMNGFDAARFLKRLMPIVPLIMYSAFGDRFVEHQARFICVASSNRDVSNPRPSGFSFAVVDCCEGWTISVTVPHRCR